MLLSMAFFKQFNIILENDYPVIHPYLTLQIKLWYT